MEVKVTPQRLKCIMALGVATGETSTAEKISDVMDLPLDEVIDALDGLLTAGVVHDLDAEEFFFTDYGESLFRAIYEGTAAATREG